MYLIYPNVFSAASALSPVFRATDSRLREVGPFDEDHSNSIGFRVSQASVSHDCVLDSKSKMYIRTHNDDFGYTANEGSGYEPNKAIFVELSMCLSTGKSHVIVDEFNLEGSGHSGAYWKLVLPEALNWLINGEQQQGLSL